MTIASRRLALAALALLLPAAARADAAKIAIFPFDLVNTSPANSTPAELARTQHMTALLGELLAKSGRYAPMDMTKADAALKDLPPVHSCNGCEIAVAKAMGAKLAAYGWVQKVSNLILNVNVVIEDVSTGKQISGGSADIRGNTDESWDHGLKYVLEENVFDKS